MKTLDEWLAKYPKGETEKWIAIKWLNYKKPINLRVFLMIIMRA